MNFDKYSKIKTSNGIKISNLLNEEIKNNKKSKILICLENIDNNKIIPEICCEKFNFFLTGIEIIKNILNYEVLIILPPGNKKLGEKLLQFKFEVQYIDFIKPILYKNYLFLDMISLINIGEMENRPIDKITLGILENKFILKDINLNIKFKELFDITNLQGLKIGYKYYNKNIFEEVLTLDFDYGDYCITPIKDDECIVNNVKKQLFEYSNRSCGNCLFCREGLIHLNIYTDNIKNNHGTMDEYEFIKEIGKAMESNNLCSVGSKGSKIILSSIDNFDKIFIEHIKNKECSVNICTNSNKIYIDPKLCTGCEDCVDICPENCIDGKKKYIHMIDEFECINCEKCISICSENAIKITKGKLPKLPRKLIKTGKFK